MITTAVGALALTAGPATAAESGVIYSGGGSDCAGKWDGTYFYLMDRAGDGDNDYCYIDYGSTPKLPEKRRVSIPIDDQINTWQQTEPPDLSGMTGTVYFKVCEERENDPDLCSNVGGYAVS